MNRLTLAALLFSAAVTAQSDPMPKPVPTADDPYQWLEDVAGEKSLAWVRERNAASQKQLAESDLFRELNAKILSILDSTARIPFVSKQGAHYYNLWQDAQNPRGLWRRTTLEEYQLENPKWEVVLDLDALGKAENENWVWHGASFLHPQYRLCLISLSRGGADASVVREFDVVKKEFVKDGFTLPEAKSNVSWCGENAIFVGTDFGPGSMTSSGYPRVAKTWKRGTPLADAKIVAQGEASDVALTAGRDQTKGFERDFVSRGLTFFSNNLFLLKNEELIRIEKPDSANANVHREWLFVELRDDWNVDGKKFLAGSLLACNFDAFLDGERKFDVLFEPTDRSSLAGFSSTKNHVLLNVLDNVRNKITVLTHDGTQWKREPLPGLPEFGTIAATAIDDEESDDYFLTITDYLQPTSLWIGTVGKGPAKKLKSLPAFFDASGLEVTQREARSKDGTRVPYFLVCKKGLVRDGNNPTLLYGYGGFEVSMTPNYSAGVGTSWLARGGVYVVANIRGGGEFGPKWHQAALKQNRVKAYEDFAAVAEDLAAQKITSPRHLGIQGGSNGGLLMGNMLTMFPQLFNAVVCQVPLLDMLRYHKLLAGASWMGEYGDPDVPEEAKWLTRYSPYHNVKGDGTYPKVLFTTSTRDDRVHPGHARKMMARMIEQKHDALYYENIEGGHGGAADNKQAAFMAALAYSFLWQQLK